MNCEELSRLIPDIVDDLLPEELRAEVDEAIANCPQCRQEIEMTRQVRTVLTTIQTNYPQMIVPAGFERNLLARIQQRQHGLELLDLSSKAFGEWLVEWINLIGGLINMLGVQQPGQDA
jgi:hypothetical protein